MVFRFLFVAVIFSANLLGWPQVPEDQRGRATTSTRKSDKAQGPIPPTHIIVDPPIPTSGSQPPAPTKKDEPIEKQLPRYGRPEWVIVYITAVYCFITWLTLRKIKIQAELMKEQLADARSADSLASTNATATLAAIQEQSSMMKRQADLMERQATVMEIQAQAAKDNVFVAQAMAEIAKLGVQATGVGNQASALNAKGALLSASAARDSAETAKINAQSLINSQRAWVLVDKINDPILSDNTPEEILAFAGVSFFGCSLKVFGTTPAKITGAGVRFHLQAKKHGATIPEPDLPDEPDYRIGTDKTDYIPPGYVKAPGDNLIVQRPLEDGALGSEQISLIEGQMLFVCAYGFVSYLDAFERPHETRFCYIHRISKLNWIAKDTGRNMYPTKFVIGGPPAYNRYT